MGETCKLCDDARCDGYVCESSRENILESRHVLAAEVERLRAENSLLIMENIGREELKAKVAELEAQNAELRARLNRFELPLETENLALKARLAWFEEREKVIRPVVLAQQEGDYIPDAALEDIATWEAEHPQAGGSMNPWLKKNPNPLEPR